ncbi:MAG: hypothetical protein U0Z44_02880 [Kouleothrix sp.]
MLGSIWLGRFAQLRRRGLIAYGGLLASGFGVLLYVLPGGLPGIAAGALVFGVSMAAFGLVWTNTLQESVPGELLGRVSNIDHLGSIRCCCRSAMRWRASPPTGWARRWFSSWVGSARSGWALLGQAHPAIRWRLD